MYSSLDFTWTACSDHIGFQLLNILHDLHQICIHPWVCSCLTMLCHYYGYKSTITSASTFILTISFISFSFYCKEKKKVYHKIKLPLFEFVTNSLMWYGCFHCFAFFQLVCTWCFCCVRFFIYKTYLLTTNNYNLALKIQ